MQYVEPLGRLATAPSARQVAKPVYLVEVEALVGEAGRMARRGAPAGSMVAGESRTLIKRGWGRRAKVPAGHLLTAAVVLRPPAALDGVALARAARASVAAALRESIDGRLVTVDGNDLVVGGRLVGRLDVRAQTRAGTLEALVVGVGVNVASSEADLPRRYRDSLTSLALTRGRRVHRGEVLARVLARLTSLNEGRGGERDPLFPSRHERHAEAVAERPVASGVAERGTRQAVGTAA